YDDSKNPFVARQSEATTPPRRSPGASPKPSPSPSPSGSTTSRGSTMTTTPSRGRVYKIEKQSLTDPYALDILDKETGKLAYSKIQRYTYAWGFAAALVLPGGKNSAHEGVEEDLKEEEDEYVVSSVRRAAYQKEIGLAWYPEHYSKRDTTENENE